MKRLRKIGGHIILLIGLLSPLDGQNHQFRYLTPQEGLEDGAINAMTQDSSGTMWFATFDGLISYDGYSLRTYKSRIGDQKSLTARQVTSLFLDSRDNVWVGTAYGICRYDKVSDDFDRFELPDYTANRYFGIFIIEVDETIILKAPHGLFY